MTDIKNSNILITGGTGFIGSHLIEELQRQKANLVTTYLSLNPLSYFVSQKLNKKIMMINADVCDFEKVYDIITKHQIDYIFHLAAQPLVEVAYHNPRRTLYTNILGTVNLLESARLYPNIKGVIVASSDKAYGKMSQTESTTSMTRKARYSESGPLQGDHPYEVSKSSADLIVQAYFKTYNLPVVVTRFGNIYGEGDLHYSRILPGILKALIKEETLKIRSTGQYVRDYLYVKDVVRGYLLLLSNIEKVKGEAFNFGSLESLSVLDLIKVTERILQKKIKYKITNTAVNEIPYQSLDFSKIGRFLKWKPEYKLKDTLPKIYSWYRIHIKK